MAFDPKPPFPWTVAETIGWSFVVLIIFVAVSHGIAFCYILLQALQNRSLSLQQLSQNIETDGQLLSIATGIAGLCSSGFLYGLIKHRSVKTIAPCLGLQTPRPSAWLIWNLLLLLVILFSDSILRALEQSQTFTEQIYQTSPNPALLYITLVLIAPIFEEFLFRGFMLAGLRSSRVGSMGAVIVTSLLWAMLHFQYNFYFVAQIFVFGLLLGVARLQTESLYVPISMHSLNNLIALITTGINLSS
ncbi:MAG: CPBP family intramembrane metalloprotease [Acaryochloridaceae cyanobacterium SU_2_1]|nr:CPBP family intramembrane metalloprotease [Acaryochloridaceae cyanobacterium SU_2_1]NJM95392.1 CPBP family intramembrane metalloprotease [Acaryochloridaceae cyanobacterium CSU_5_19]